MQKRTTEALVPKSENVSATTLKSLLMQIPSMYRLQKKPITYWSLLFGIIRQKEIIDSQNAKRDIPHL